MSKDISKEPKAYVRDKGTGKILGTNLGYAKKLAKKGYKIELVEGDGDMKEKMKEMINQKIIF